MNTPLLEQMVAGEAPDLLPLSVEQYHQMTAAGILPEGSPVELIDGMLVTKDRRDSGRPEMIHGPQHVLVVKRLYRAIDRRLEAFGCHAQCQMPITVAPNHEPEPDVAVIAGQPEDYADHLPTPAETLAVMEVAGSSLRYDRETKQRVYAGGGIPAYWILDLVAHRVTVHSEPAAEQESYSRQECFAPGEKVALQLKGGTTVEIPVAEIWPASATGLESGVSEQQ